MDQPNNPINAVFAGQSLAGTWTLNVSDNAQGDTGTLDQWCLVPQTGNVTAYTVGGTTSGLAGGGLVLQLNGANDQTVNTDGPFTMSPALADGATYAVTVLTQPAGQTCGVSNGSGTIAGANVTNVVVTCTTNPSYTVGGSVTGLVGGGLVLQDNGGDDLTIGADGNFTFPTTLADGAAYAVTVGTQPSGETCSVANGSGTIAGANVSNVAVSCSPTTIDRIFADGFDGP